MQLIEMPNVKITTIKAGATKNQTMSLKPVGLILLLSISLKSKVIDFRLVEFYKRFYYSQVKAHPCLSILPCLEVGDFLAKTIVLHCSCDQAESQFETEIFRIPQVIQVSFFQSRQRTRLPS